jgi:hypothetical protein
MKRKNELTGRASTTADQPITTRLKREREAPSAESLNEAEQDASDPTHEKEIPSK